jgi:CRISPR-associated endonuclease/helicase Cas3
VTKKLPQTEPDELDSGRTEVAQADAGAATPSAVGATAAQSSAQHGVRGGASGPEDAPAGTRPPHSATRFLNTTLGVISYSELAPYHALRVLALHEAIAAGAFDHREIDEELILEIHRRICADL